MRLIDDAALRTTADTGLPLLDRFIAEEGVFAVDGATTDRLRAEWIRDSATWHMAPDGPYGAYAARRGFTAETLAAAGAGTAELDAVPLLPSMLFKREGVSVAHPRALERPDDLMWTTSSGTKGRVSRIPRDDTTMRRFFASIGNLSHELLGVENSDVVVFNLGPEAEEARDLWISYVMAGLAVLLPQSRSYVRDGVLLLEELLRDLTALDGRRIAVIGPPPYLLRLGDALSLRRIRPDLAADSMVLAIGGWKRRSGERVPRDRFDAHLAGAFGLDPAQVRDTFNMVELNTVLIECGHKAKHVPPWLYVRACHPATLRTMSPGRSGVLAYLDPTARSYPGFVLSDDLGRVDRAVRCPCGRTSDVLTLERRLNTLEARGCALKLDGAPTR